MWVTKIMDHFTTKWHNNTIGFLKTCLNLF